MNSLLRTHLLLLLMATCMFSCVKNNDAEPEITTPPDKPSGVLYINCGTTFMKINTVDSTVLWENYSSTLPGSFGCPMLLDSTAFYASGTDIVAAYSTTTGDTKWAFRWQEQFPGAVQYREPVYRDSLIFFTSPTQAFNIAHLHCVNKNSGALIWKTRIDSATGNALFNSTPVLANDKVILVTKDKNSQKHLSAYKISDGTRQWTTDANSSLAARLHAANGKVYSTAGSETTCYNVATGAQEWKTDQQTFMNGTATLFENDRLILVRTEGSTHEVLTINTTDGKLVKKASVTAPAGSIEYEAFSCIYKNEKLLVVNPYGYDSINVRYFDMAKQTMIWQRRFKSLEADYYAFAPVLANNCIIFPVTNDQISGEYEVFMYLLDLEGKDIKKIPISSDIKVTAFAYQEKGVIYNQGLQFLK